MLSELKVGSLDELLEQVIPDQIRTHSPLGLPPALNAHDMQQELRSLANQNQVFRSLIGLGYYNTYTPSVIRRNVLENPAWYTAYTPYQPEISQGRLEVLLTFQTTVEELTGMEVANASVLDEASGAAEAVAMALRMNRGGNRVFWIDQDTHPQTIAVIRTRAAAQQIELKVGSPKEFDLDEAAGMLLQYPGSSGRINDYRELVNQAKATGVITVVATDLLSLTLLQPPGEWGADIVIGSSQRFGVPLFFGGPHAGFISTLKKNVRNLPGRLVGVSRDAQGNLAYRLTLQTREQHIRRERATSNLCTAQVLLSVMAGLYACWHGPEGLKRIATRIHSLTANLVTRLWEMGIWVENETFFDTITVRLPGKADVLLDRARAEHINLRPVDPDRVGISLDETCEAEVVSDLVDLFAGLVGKEPPPQIEVDGDVIGIPSDLIRTTDFLTHPVFHRYRTEHQMLRYLRRMASRDLALDRTMIPLGSCTMKLNATAEMEPVGWSEFAQIHPFAPPEQTVGYRQLIHQLENYLLEITGYDAISLQPNSGAQGELAGLLMIRAYHLSRGDQHRDVCLIPSSAHGTNAASAAMADMKVVVVACNQEGDVDLDDLAEKIEQYADRLSAIMVTYPSTHGVFEEGITDIIRMVHQVGGQVYVDGANLNALVGKVRLGEIGADVSHLNLHKTFAIPHGGGGPGVGPVACRSHLTEFLPNHPLCPEAGPGTGIGPITSAPWGSAGVLPISWAYIRLMGPDGLHRATEYSILSANYVASRLDDAFPVLYTGRQGRVAHECILDLRGLEADTGISAGDAVKRLTDYGFHAPTFSFPVAGTLMVEPTESEPKEEIDRFIEAMLSIRAEIEKVKSGEWSPDDNPLRAAPHTAQVVTADVWDRGYPRSVAAFPVKAFEHDKYWPPVGRLDETYGDRNLFCSCPPLEAWTDPSLLHS